ncbi:hypothetical protein ACH5RR_008263 [Cinchona calisaya]|uniref:Uncharacterized protein n=1 Tax=Cinchona calisaya TaxID=153742 RepID=A0ABD3ADF1_9GENT
MDWMLLESARPKQTTSVAKYFKKFEDWRIDMLDFKIELDKVYFIEKFSMGLDWNIWVKLWEFRSPPKILFEAYLQANFEEVVMKKVEVKEGRTMGIEVEIPNDDDKKNINKDSDDERNDRAEILFDAQESTVMLEKKSNCENIENLQVEIKETPIKLCGRKDAIVAWYKLETSTRSHYYLAPDQPYEPSISIIGIYIKEKVHMEYQAYSTMEPKLRWDKFCKEFCKRTGGVNSRGINEEFQVQIVKSLYTAIAKYCHHALVNMISNLVSSTIPIASKVFKKAGTYDKKRLFGITMLAVVRVKTFYVGKAKVNVAEVNLRVVGGHIGITILPLFSQVTLKANLPDEDMKALIERTQDG